MKSSSGLSDWFLLLGCVGCISTITNVFILQSPTLQCCSSSWPFLLCLENLMALIQVTSQFICFITIMKYIIEPGSPYLHSASSSPGYHYESSHDEEEDEENTNTGPSSSLSSEHQEQMQYLLARRYNTIFTPEWKRSRFIGYFLICYACFAMVSVLWVLILEKRLPLLCRNTALQTVHENEIQEFVSASIFKWNQLALISNTFFAHSMSNSFPFPMLHGMAVSPGLSLHALYLATFMGILSTCSAIVQFLPQIYVTWKNQRLGALSIPTMLIQCPGSFIFVYSLYIQPGTNWSSWVSYMFSGTCQAILLLLSLYLIIIKPEGSATVSHPDEIVNGDDERRV